MLHRPPSPLGLFEGGPLADSLSGGAADDQIFGHRGDDTLSGAGGDDWLQPGSGADVVRGGTGTDAVAYEFDADEPAALRGVDVDLAKGIAIDNWNASDLLSGIEWAFGSRLDDVLRGNEGANLLDGGRGADTLLGAAGDDWMQPGPGDDRVVGGTGEDAVSYQDDQSSLALTRGADVDLAAGTAIDGWDGLDTLAGIEWVFGSWRGDRLRGDASANVLDGSRGNDTLAGREGEDWLQPGPGDDSIEGGPGFDVLSYAGSEGSAAPAQGAVVDLATGSATDPWGGTDQFVGIENLVGSPLDDTLRGASPRHLLDGRAGNDRLSGGGIVYEEDPAGVIVNLGASARTLGGQTVAPRRALDGWGDTDVLGSGVHSGYATRFDDAWFGDDVSAFAVLRAGNDRVLMGAGDDWLQPGSGDDRINGGPGFDGVSYLDDGFDSAGPAFRGVRVDLAAGTATDGWDGSDVLIGIEDVYGSALDDELIGDAEWNYLEGGGGNDTLAGGGGRDYFLGGAGDDSVDGGAGRDFFAVAGASLADYGIVYNTDGSITVTDLVPGDGDDGIDRLVSVEVLGLAVQGSAGDDLILSDGTDPILAIGADGDDRYVLQYVEDQVLERPTQGTDTVEAGISRVLEPNVENLVLTGLAAIDGTGNGAANNLLGNAADNALDGGAGADTLAGGDGNDTYYVDDRADLVIEDAPAPAPAGGPRPPLAGGTNIDTVISQVSYTLRANIENLELAGAGNLSGTGNELDNLLTGNGGDNLLDGKDGVDILDGGGGNDTLVGGAGNDTLGGGAGNDLYRVTAGDSVLESASSGTDTVESAVDWTLADALEALVLTGSANVDGTGSKRANTLAGNGGNNVLNGKAGADTLTGGAGADVFVFDTALAANVDQVTSFQAGTDRIRLDDDVFTALTGGVALTAGQFHAGAGVTTAADAEDRILYNTTNGALYYDADGSGGAFAPLRFATLGNAPQLLSQADFQVVG